MNPLIPGAWEYKPEAELEPWSRPVQDRPTLISKPLVSAVLIATAMVLWEASMGIHSS